MDRIIKSPKTHETFIFKDEWNDERGFVKQLEYLLEPGHRIPSHLHPGTKQFFRVLEGELYVSANGQTKLLKAGDKFETAVGGTHSQWNKGPNPTRVLEGYNPPINIEPFFTILPVALETRNPFKIFVMMSDFSSIVTTHSNILRFVIEVLAKIGRMFGYKDWYRPILARRAILM